MMNKGMGLGAEIKQMERAAKKEERVRLRGLLLQEIEKQDVLSRKKIVEIVERVCNEKQEDRKDGD
jgi:hypothetical protein